MNKFGALLFACVLGLSGCSGEKGANGVDGTNGQDGTDGTDGMSAVTGKLTLVIDGVATTATTSTLTFTIYPAAAACPGGACDDKLSNMTQKVFYAAEYDAATKTFSTAHNFQFNGGFKFQGIVDGGKGAQYTAVTKAGVNPSFVPETSQSAMIYGYVADATVLPAPATGHYSFPDNVASAAKVYGAVDYASAANVSGCEKCHGAPYSKHGYRQARVAGLPDFAACKACHTGQRAGSDQAWQKIVDDPAGYKADGVTTADKTKYAYTANVMNDTHMSHAMEFNFPQSMANCVACHEGKLDVVLADEFFTIKTCTSCHPVNGKGGTDGKRAPALMGDGTAASPGVMPSNVHGTMDLANTDCRLCHKPGSARTFKQIHSGRTATIYAADGTRYSDVFTTKVDSASFDKATNVLTVNFSATKTDGASITQTAANIVPTVVVSLYGYDAKDFVVGGHGTHADGARNLEAAVGGTAHPRITFSGTAPSWTATIDLSTWAAQIGASIERAEVGILPKLLSNLADANSPALAIKGVTQTVDLIGATTLVADKDSYGKAIVDPAKCNACHDALGTTFHNASYGSAGVVACRLCHIVGNGGSHLEMQSRSIDSYVHAIHSMQAFDVGMSKPVAQWTAAELDSHIDFNDPIAVLRHELHVEGNYPNFAGTLNCESCHNTGTYDVPNQAKSLPSILSASADYLNGSTRAISGVPSYIVGPASRACGSCHRAELINEEDAGTLAAFNQHTALNGTLALAGTTTAAAAATLDAVTQNIMAKVGGPAASLTAPAGTQIETCTICHPNAGADHQAAFNRWADGL